MGRDRLTALYLFNPLNTGNINIAKYFPSYTENKVNKR